SRRIVPVIPPSRVVEVNHKIAVVRDDSVIEGQSAHIAPVFESAMLRECRTLRGALIGRLDPERKSAFWHRLALVKNLRHYLVTKVQCPPLNSQLLRRNQKAHKPGTAGGFTRWLSEFSDLVQLAVRRLLIYTLKERTCDQQNWHSTAAT